MKKTKSRFKITLMSSGSLIALALLFTNCSPATFESNSIGTILENDPLTKYAWHLRNTGQDIFAEVPAVAGNDLNLRQSWEAGYYGAGIRILVSDDGVEDTHEDLQENYLYGNQSKDYSLPPPFEANISAPRGKDDNHGTAVAGLIAAVAGNGKGARGVAPRAQIASANFLGSGQTPNTTTFLDQAGGDYDIFNMSWGTGQDMIDLALQSFEDQLAYGTTHGRNGHGSIYVKAAGNEFFTYCNGSSSLVCVGNANFDPDNVNPYVIVTAALNSMGNASSYSSAGANVWISSFGGEYGVDSPAMVTTDRTSCNEGYAALNSTWPLGFEKGEDGNSDCKYSVTFNGTSSATPILSGVVALILEANPQLSWRDVKYILAKTARKLNPTSSNISHPRGLAVPSGVTWDLGWVTNTAGFHHHNWYGFGQVDVDAALAMARNYSSAFKAFTRTNWVDNLSSLTASIPDNSATGASSAMMVNSDLKIESVQLKVWITHPDISQLALELTSPSGVKSILVNMRNSLTGITNYQGETFMSNAFYQENSKGVWTLKVIDGMSGQTGTLTRWSLNFSGAVQ